MIIDNRYSSFRDFYTWKFLLSTAAAFFLLLAGFKGHTQTKPSLSTDKKPDTTEQKFAKELFTAFKKNDEALWLALQPTEKEYKDLLQLMLASKVEGLTQQKIDEMMERRKREVIAAYKKELTDLQAQAAKAGVDWASATYKRFDYEAVYPAEFPKKYLTGAVRFSAKGGDYIIEDIQAVEISPWYKLQSIKHIRKAEAGE